MEKKKGVEKIFRLLLKTFKERMIIKTEYKKGLTAACVKKRTNKTKMTYFYNL